MTAKIYETFLKKKINITSKSNDIYPVFDTRFPIDMDQTFIGKNSLINYGKIFLFAQ